MKPIPKRRSRITPCAFSVIFLLALATPAVQAQLARSYVAPFGSDANSCKLTSPCRQIGRAIDAAQTGGEVVILLTGEYQPFTINKTISVTAAHGASPAVKVTSADGVAVTVTAGAGSAVVLRGLTLLGPNTATATGGVSGGSSVSSLHVEDCVIAGFGIGIGFSSSGTLSVKDTSIRNCSSGVQTSSTLALFEDCWIEANGTGLLAGVGSKVTIRRSIATANGQALTGGGSGTELNIEDCTVSNNGDGIRSDTPGTVVRVANSVITGNNRGLAPDFGGALLSRSPASNTVEGNTTNGSFTGTYSAK